MRLQVKVGGVWWDLYRIGVKVIYFRLGDTELAARPKTEVQGVRLR